MKCEICGIRDAVTSYIEEKNGQKQMIHVCEECFQNQENIEELRCDVCMMSYREFLKAGVFGCENCYRVFKAQTVKILENQILKDKQNLLDKTKEITIKVTKSKKTRIPSKVIKSKEKKEFLKELEDLLELAKQENDIEKVERIETEIKRLKSLEIEMN